MYIQYHAKKILKLLSLDRVEKWELSIKGIMGHENYPVKVILIKFG